MKNAKGENINQIHQSSTDMISSFANNNIDRKDEINDDDKNETEKNLAEELQNSSKISHHKLVRPDGSVESVDTNNKKQIYDDNHEDVAMNLEGSDRGSKPCHTNKNEGRGNWYKKLLERMQSPRKVGDKRHKCDQAKKRKWNFLSKLLGRRSNDLEDKNALQQALDEDDKFPNLSTTSTDSLSDDSPICSSPICSISLPNMDTIENAVCGTCTPEALPPKSIDSYFVAITNTVNENINQIHQSAADVITSLGNQTKEKEIFMFPFIESDFPQTGDDNDVTTPDAEILHFERKIEVLHPSQTYII